MTAGLSAVELSPFLRFLRLFAATPIAPTVGLASEAALHGYRFDFARFRNRALRSSRSPREAIYAEAAWIVLYNPVVLYHDVGGGCRG
jgi:hypothetical protein